MKIKDFFDNLHVVFKNKDEDEDYAFTQAVVYRDLKTGAIESIQIINKEYNEFLVVERNGEINVANLNEFDMDNKK